MSTYHNEYDAQALQWLSNLAEAGLIRDGIFDGRDIQEVKPDDVRGYRVCHFFAGIGGWPYALEIAGWDPTRPVWTASCPCQPWSVAGKGEGENDPRHLWPVLRDLVAECRPPVIFGEQVESKAGRRWLAGVRADLEALGYRVGAADLCAAGAGERAEGRFVRGDQILYERITVGAPQIRQRLFWVADTQRSDVRGSGSGSAGGSPGRVQGTNGERQRLRADARPGRAPVVFGFDEIPYDELRRRAEWDPAAARAIEFGEIIAESRRRMANGGTERRDRGTGLERGGWPTPERREAGRDAGDGGFANGMAGTQGVGLDEQRREAGCSLDARRPVHGEQFTDSRRVGRLEHPQGHRRDERGPEPSRGSTLGRRRPGFWSDFDLIDCADQKTRRIEPGSQCLVDGVPFRLADGRTATAKSAHRNTLLKGFGNAIVPELAAEFIGAYMEAER